MTAIEAQCGLGLCNNQHVRLGVCSLGTAVVLWLVQDFTAVRSIQVLGLHACDSTGMAPLHLERHGRVCSETPNAVCSDEASEGNSESPYTSATSDQAEAANSLDHPRADALCTFRAAQNVQAKVRSLALDMRMQHQETVS